ncbi:hsp90 chloroplast targeted [Nannochloropsis gaditana]|uniref:Hsp90 chloroplast targeted n=1 Tax=Nannochloropsis gaditana TaxID=72520 RepID=W7U0P8_9STRA|nr:hsp90 chloroplast targeted [Nannochloropsis gaditana]
MTVSAEFQADILLDKTADAGSPSRKRRKKSDVDSSPLSQSSSDVPSNAEAVTALNDCLLDLSHIAKLKQSYPSAPGYPHCVVKDVLEAKYFRELREEMVTSLAATFKETDLFKLYQTGDLANLDGSDPEVRRKMPRLLALRDAIYSPKFRAFVREITGCRPLTDRTDCSSNLYTQGCHLLCHDDVIGTRCISFIIYLTDPDETWGAEDGGALEIYPLSGDSLGVPKAVPLQNHPPKPNTMAFFTVLPGQSFHAVEEVYSEKMRLSISGWYHADDPPMGAEALASLNQLQMRQDETPQAFSPLRLARALHRTASGPGSVNPLLARWVNPTYLTPGAIEQIAARFQADKSILLHEFLLPCVAMQAARLLRSQDQADRVGGGQKPTSEVGLAMMPWELIGPPHKQRYLRLGATGLSSDPVEKAKTATDLMAALRGLFGSEAFARYLARLTGSIPSGVRTEARRFRPGLDYTLAHYGILTKDPRLDATLAFVDDGNKAKKELWESGDVGGFGCYIKAEVGNDGAEAAESYRRQAHGEEDDQVLNVSAAHNALSLVLRETQAMRFVKYVSAAAPGSRWDVVSEYCLDGEERVSDR